MESHHKRNRTCKGEVYIVDDDSEIRKALRLILASDGIRVKTFDSAESFLKSSQITGPACAIVDVQLPGITGIELQQELTGKHPELPVVLLTAHADVPMAVNAMRRGAWHFLEKPCSASQLIAVVDEALEWSGERRIAHRELAEWRRRFRLLTAREAEIAKLLSTGSSAKEIACLLRRSHHTVAHQRKSILEKMEVESVVDLTRILIKLETLDSETQPA